MTPNLFICFPTSLVLSEFFVQNYLHSFVKKKSINQSDVIVRKFLKNKLTVISLILIILFLGKLGKAVSGSGHTNNEILIPADPQQISKQRGRIIELNERNYSLLYSYPLVIKESLRKKYWINNGHPHHLV